MPNVVHLAALALVASFASFALLFALTTSAASEQAAARARTQAAHMSNEAHAACALHASAHDRTALDDDDDLADDEGESSTLAPSGDDGDDRDDRDDRGAAADEDDAAALPSIAGAARFTTPGAAESLARTRRGLRASGEHRPCSDRPPRV